MRLAEAAKAVAAAGTAGVAAFTTALLDGHISAVEWAGVGLAVVLAGVAVFATPNAEAPPPLPTVYPPVPPTPLL